MTDSYRAICLERFAASFRAATEIVALPVTGPGPGELRVRNRWCGVNGIFDTQMARDAVDYIRFQLPTLTGVEAVGIVEAVGDGVTGFKPGDAVASFRFRSGYREMNTAPAADFARVPDTSRDSLALASSGVAAWLALHHAGQMKPGETVAISAAAGGLGHLMVQIAKAKGCRVVAVCGGADKVALVRSLGADRVIDHRAEDVAAVLASGFGDALDVAVDTVGGRVFDAFLDNLAPDGRLVVSGAASDMDGTPHPSARPRLPLGFYYKSASIRAFQNGRVQHLWPEARAEVFALAAQGALTPAFDPTPYTGLEQAADAVEALLSGRTLGKVALALGTR